MDLTALQARINRGEFFAATLTACLVPSVVMALKAIGFAREPWWKGAGGRIVLKRPGKEVTLATCWPGVRLTVRRA